jgi:hypothetical protein
VGLYISPKIDEVINYEKLSTLPSLWVHIALNKVLSEYFELETPKLFSKKKKKDFEF